MNVKNFRIIFFSIFLIACTGKITDSTEKIPTSGEVTLTSKTENGKIPGFSFSQGKIINYSNSNDPTPDIIVLVHLDPNSVPLGVFLSSISLKPTYCFKYWSSSMDSSLAYFDSLSIITDTLFTELAIPIKEAQVWTINTHDDMKAKILIKNSLAYIDNTNTPYGEVSFKWEYQPDGNNSFEQ